MDDDLFPGFDFASHRAPQPGSDLDGLSPTRRRTIRQTEALRAGRHPLSLATGKMLLLHPDAPPADARDAPGPRCGSCRFRELVHGGNQAFPKCTRGRSELTLPWASHGAGTDVRAWWPACAFWEPLPGRARITAVKTINVTCDDLGIIAFRHDLDANSVEHLDGAWTLTSRDGARTKMRFLTADGTPTGVAAINPISAAELEIVQVPGGPLIEQIELVTI